MHGKNKIALVVFVVLLLMSSANAAESIYSRLKGVDEGYAIVLGKSAPASDTLAAITIATGMQNQNGVRLTAVMENEAGGEKYILLGHPCDNTLIPLSCRDWPYESSEALIMVAGENIIVAGSTAEDTREAAQIIADYKDYSILKQHDVVVIKEGRLTALTVDIAQREGDIEEPVCGDGICEEGDCLEDCSIQTNEAQQEELSETVVEKEMLTNETEQPVEKKRLSFSERVWDFIVGFFKGLF